MICSKCGYVALDGDVFCIKCGNPLIKPEPAAPEEAQSEIRELREEVYAAEETANTASEETEDVLEETEDVSEAFAEEAVTAAEAVTEAEGEPVEELGDAFKAAPAEEENEDLFAEEAQKPVDEDPAPETLAEVPEVRFEADEPEPSEDPDAQVYDEAVEEAPAEQKKPRRSILTRIERPLSVWGFIWRTILFSIPVVNIIPLFVFAFAPGINKNSKNYASAALILLLIGLIAAVIVGFLIFSSTDPTVMHDFILKYFKISI